MRLLIVLLLPLCLFATAGYFEPWGKDEALLKQSCSCPKRTTGFAKVSEELITVFQKVISPIDGPRSNFRPTSSRYMQLAMQRYGFVQGLLMGMDRLLRENNDEWVYPKVVINDLEYKYDPALVNKNDYPR